MSGRSQGISVHRLTIPSGLRESACACPQSLSRDKTTEAYGRSKAGTCECHVTSDNRNLLDVLKQEFRFIEQGDYRNSPRDSQSTRTIGWVLSTTRKAMFAIG